MSPRPTRRLLPQSSTRSSLCRSLVVGYTCVYGVLGCADDPGLPYPTKLGQGANEGASPSNGAGAPGEGQANGVASSTDAAGEPNGAGLGINPSPPPPPTMTMLPPRPATPSSTSGGEPTTAPEPAEDDAEDTPAGGQFGGFFGTGTGTDMDTGAESETDETTDATDPPANSGTGATFGGGFAGTPTPSATAPAAMTCTPLAVGIASGDIGTEAKCFTVMGTLQGWQVSNLGTRSLTVNDAPAIAPMLPAASDGGYTFAFGAGEPLYTAFSTW